MIIEVFDKELNLKDNVLADSYAQVTEYLERYRKIGILERARSDADAILYAVKVYADPDSGEGMNTEEAIYELPYKLMLFPGCAISTDELNHLIKLLPDAELGVLWRNYKKAARAHISKMRKSRHIVPITLKEANTFVKAHHRHNDTVTGCKFAIGLADRNQNLLGCAICGRPVSRQLDDGGTLEVNRLCVSDDILGNTCSMLYGACVRIAKNMGYQKVITYTLQSETAASVKASGFRLAEENCGGSGKWNSKRSKISNRKELPNEKKNRWEYVICQG